MSKWTIYATSQIVMDSAAREAVVNLCRNTFFDDFAPGPLFGSTTFPPDEAIVSSKFIVVDTIDNRWSELKCIGGVAVRGGIRASVMAPFSEVNEAYQDQAFLVLVMPSAAEQHFEGRILEKVLEAGFYTYAMRYYHMTLAPIWTAHYERHSGSPNFAAKIASLANRPTCAFQVFFPGHKAATGMAAARQLFKSEIADGLVHVTENLDDVKRERDIWIEENDEDDEAPVSMARY